MTTLTKECQFTKERMGPQEGELRGGEEGERDGEQN